MSDPVPDHATFSKNRHGRFRDSDLLRHVFEATVHRCILEGLVGGERFAVDASLIEADVNVHHAAERADRDPATIDPDTAPRAVKEYLAVLDDAAFGAASEVTSKFVAHADPAAQEAGTKRRAAIFAYSTNDLIDTDNAIIIDVRSNFFRIDRGRNCHRHQLAAIEKRTKVGNDRLPTLFCCPL